MRGSLSRLRAGKISAERIPKYLLWAEAYPGEEEPFLLANGEELGIMIFAIDRDLHLAAHSDVIVCDATFKTSPNNASQALLGLHARMFNKDNEYEWFTFAFAPMRKLSSSYEFIYKTLREAWIRLECDIDKPKFRVEFEKVQINAISCISGPEKVSG